MPKTDQPSLATQLLARAERAERRVAVLERALEERLCECEPETRYRCGRCEALAESKRIEGGG